MVIEVFKWSGGQKSHVRNQDFPRKTLCGLWIPEHAQIVEGDDAFPSCLRCADAVMRS